MKKGYLALVLHTHLPYIKHPEEDYFLEENWLYEAITESYLPLLDVFNRLRKENVYFQLTMSITPPLVNMLSDSLLLERYDKYIRSRISLVEEELKENINMPKGKILAFYQKRLKHLYELFSKQLNSDILKGFKDLQDGGFLEIITCTATHEILPLEQNNKIKEIQVEVGVDTYKEAFGRNPNGIWLGECAYTKGLDKILSDNGILFTVLDSHGLLHGEPPPVFGISAPVISNNGVVFFGRDPMASKQVWSASEGYPGDFKYREFYKDIGYEISPEKVKRYLHPAGFRFDSGIKLHKITGKVPLKDKELYDPEAAFETAETHAGNYMFNMEKEAEYLLNIYKKEPIIVVPFDTELFGHWWFEGPEFLYSLFNKISKFSKSLETVSLSRYIDRFPIMQISEPDASSWGEGGYFKVWLNEETDWIYEHLNVLGKRMMDCSNRFQKPSFLQKRLLNQMARELLLAESSDWAFLITVGTAVSYARSREIFHINSFNYLYDQLINGKFDLEFLDWLSIKDSIFPKINYEIFKEDK